VRQHAAAHWAVRAAPAGESFSVIGPRFMVGAIRYQGLKAIHKLLDRPIVD